MQSMDKLDLILQKLEQVDGKLQKFDERMDRFEERMDRFEVRQQQFEEKQNRFEEKQIKFEERQTRFEERQTKFEERLDSLDAGQKELFQMTKAIIHRQELTDARLEALTLDVHKIHGLMVSFQASQDRQDKILEILSMRSLEQESDIRELKRSVNLKL